MLLAKIFSSSLYQLSIHSLQLQSLQFHEFNHKLKFCLCPIQLRESQAATHSVKEELAQMVKRYHEKVSQWENSQEALDQLTDELQANQNALRENQQKVDDLKGLIDSLQEQVDTLKQQVRTNIHNNYSNIHNNNTDINTHLGCALCLCGDPVCIRDLWSLMIL